MTLTALNYGVCTCPTCGVEWYKDEYGYWYGESISTTRDPLEGGRTVCPECAVESATEEHRETFVRNEVLYEDFIRWLVQDHGDAKEAFNLLAGLKDAWFEQRLAEFVQEEAEEEFREWRCGA